AHHHKNEEQIERNEGQNPGERAVQESVNQQVGSKLLEERDIERGRVLVVRLHPCERDSENTGNQHLQAELAARGESEIALFFDLGPVVDEADGAEGKQREDRQTRIHLLQVSPEKSRDQNTDDDEDTAHGGRARLLLVPLRTVLAYMLTDL